MKTVIYFLYNHLPLFNVLGAIALFLKALLIYNQRTKSVAAFVWSFMKFYRKRDLKSARSRKKIRYMVINNLLNIYFYLWMTICLVILFVYLTVSSKNNNLFIHF